LADALSDLEDEHAENDAIALLENTYKSRSDFSFGRHAGVLRMKQLRRKIRQAKAAIKANADDENAKVLLEQLSKQLHDFELEHYGLCVKNYPTDLSAKFEYGIRLVADKQYDQAIPLLQQAQRDPRRKLAAMSKVGFCFAEKGWLEDAIDVYTKAINSYEIKEDAVAKELRYNLGDAYEQQGDTDKALEVYRRIAQVDFTYKDVSSRVDKLRRSRNKPDSQ
jgi:tetratricopeptide (TPR) repeat protein